MINQNTISGDKILLGDNDLSYYKKGYRRYRVWDLRDSHSSTNYYNN